MISQRFLVPVCILLALACVPTVIHSYVGASQDDGLRTAAIPAKLGSFGSNPTKRHTNWGREIYDSDDWIERTYGNASVADVRLFVARGYDPKKLYHHPELAVLHGIDFTRARAATIRIGDQDAPVFVLDGTNGRGVAAYALLYDDRYVANPLRFQLETALKLLLSEPRAMTLLLAYDPAADVSAPLENSAVASVLRGAITSFRAQTPVNAAHRPSG
jgi:hypothetical protein